MLWKVAAPSLVRKGAGDLLFEFWHADIGLGLVTGPDVSN